MSSTSTEVEQSSSSSLLSQLQTKLKKLAPTQTKLTNPDGKVSYLEHQGLNELEGVKGQEERSFGFVVDTKPDLSVGEVLPWLWISSQDPPQDLTIIQKLGITHILSLLPGFELNPRVKPFIKEHLVVELFDDEKIDETCLKVIDQAVAFIESARPDQEQSNKILIHCNAGLSRAPTIASVYLMKKENLRFEEAWKKVKNVRRQAKPNAGFMQILTKDS